MPKWSFTCTSEKQVYSVTLYKNRLLGDQNKGSLTFTCDSKADSGMADIKQNRIAMKFRQIRPGVSIMALTWADAGRESTAGRWEGLSVLFNVGHSWPSVDAGEYHFTLTKSDNGVYVVGSGAVSYPK